MRLRPLLAILAVLALAPAAHAAQPPIGHVFVIVLENEDAASTFGPESPAPYLAQTLTADGAFVPGYYGIGHASLDNYLAMVSGQAPNLVTQADCPLFLDVLPVLPTSDGQVLGQGCGRTARSCSRPSSVRARPPISSRTTTACSGRSRTPSGWRTSATPRRPTCARSAPTCSPADRARGFGTRARWQS